MNEYSAEVQVLNLLLTIEKYHSHFRRLKQLKNEALNAKPGKGNKNIKRSNDNISIKDNESEKTTTKKNPDGEQTSDDEVQSKRGSARSKKSNASRINKAASNLRDINEDEDMATTARDSLNTRRYY